MSLFAGVLRTEDLSVALSTFQPEVIEEEQLHDPLPRIGLAAPLYQGPGAWSEPVADARLEDVRAAVSEQPEHAGAMVDAGDQAPVRIRDAGRELG